MWRDAAQRVWRAQDGSHDNAKGGGLGVWGVGLKREFREIFNASRKKAKEGFHRNWGKWVFAIQKG